MRNSTITKHTMSFSSVTLLYLCILLLVLAEYNTVSGKEISRVSKPNTKSHPLAQENLFRRLKRSPRQLKLCGNQLINMLGIICRVYHGNRDTIKYVEDLGSNSVLRKKRSLENYSNSIRRHVSSFVAYIEQGLSSQCCVSSCSLQQLLHAC